MVMRMSKRPTEPDGLSDRCMQGGIGVSLFSVRVQTIRPTGTLITGSTLFASSWLREVCIAERANAILSSIEKAGGAGAAESMGQDGEEVRGVGVRGTLCGIAVAYA